MNAGKKIEHSHEFSKVDKFIWNWFQLNKKFLIDINKYFQRLKDALIIVRTQMEYSSKIFIIDNPPLAEFRQSSEIFFNVY